VSSPNKNNFKQVINSMDTSKLNRISYVGGEPFITGEANEIMDYAAENSLRFHFFTNLTFWPEKFLPKLKKCEKVFAAFSIDAIGELNDYIRHGSDWNTVETIFHKWLDFFDKEIEHSTLTISVTVQAYNFHNIPKMKEYFSQYKVIPSFIKIERPNYLKINALPPKYIEKIMHKDLEPYIEDYKFSYPLYLQLKKYTADMDKLLGKNLKDYLPVLAEHFDSTM
jgi:MoaA/NifB/PqqE/SkfB family radical SAM enzyme